MFDGLLVEFTVRRLAKPLSTDTLPWHAVALCFAASSVALAIFFPEVFGAPLERF